MPSSTPTTPLFSSAAAATAASSSPRSMSLGNAHPSGTTSSGSRPQTPSSATTVLLPSAMRGSMGGLTFDDVLRWSEEEVCAWLQSVRMGTHSSTFMRNDITGAVIFDLDNAALKEMGVATVGDRIRITSSIKKLKRQCLETETVSHLSADFSQQHHAGTSSLGHSIANLPHGHNQLQSSPFSALGSQSTSSHQRHNSDSIEWVEGSGSRRGSATATTSAFPSRASPLPPQGYTVNGNDGMSTSPTTASSGRGHHTLREIRGLGSNSWTVQRARDSTNAPASRNAMPQQFSHQQRGSLDSRPSTVGTGAGIGGGLAAEGSPTLHAFNVQRPSTTDGGNRGIPPSQHGSAASSTLPLTPVAENKTLARHPYAIGPYRSPMPDTSRVTSPQQQPPSIDDVKKKTIKFIGEDGTTKILAVSDCRDAFDVLARVLRKFNKPAYSNVYRPTAGQVNLADDDTDLSDMKEMWGIFAMSGEGHIKFLTDNELLAICHAPQPHDPLRERGLILRRIYKGDDSMRRPMVKRSKLESFFGVATDKMGAGPFHNMDDAGHVITEGKKMNRASTISILSGLGVNAARDKEGASPHLSGHFRDGSAPSPSVLPKKTRNFHGQRPPSELISSHLTDYFPTAEKRVLERTARRSIYGKSGTSLRSKRESTWSFAADPDAPPLPSKESFDGSQTPSILIGMDRNESADQAGWASHQAPVLPPVRSSIDGWSRTVQAPGVSGPGGLARASNRPTSFRRTSGESSRSRQSLATKLRMARGIGASDDIRSKNSSNISRGDRSDTASLLTVDEITQEVENRHESASMHSSNHGWVVDEDGEPIPLPVSGRTKTSSSIAGSTRPSSQLSDADVAESEHEDSEAGELYPDRGTPVDAPGEEMDRHLGDPMAMTRISDDEEPPDDIAEDDDLDEDDLSDEEAEESQGVYKSAAPGREPFKWIKGALIGAGSFGNVFLGMNARNGLLMAVKQVELPSSDSHSDQRKKGMLEALEREIELLKTLQHDNIVQYLDSYADGTHLNIFLEYVPGGSVAALLRNYGAFQESLVRSFVKQILHGLNFLHSRDIVHRDIKGANILVDNKSCIKISDFGISKKIESDLYVTSRAHRPSLQGSVFWMAPEVVKQTSYTRKADIWSLGCLVVEMISGTHPWANLNQMQALYQIGLHSKPSLPDEISPEAVDFLNKTFELDHTNRPSADELLQHPFITTDMGATGSVDDTTTAASSAFDEANSTALSSVSGSVVANTPSTGVSTNKDTPPRTRLKGAANARRANKESTTTDAPGTTTGLIETNVSATT